MFKIQHLEFSRFPPYVTSRRHRDKAVPFEKRSFLMIFGSLNSSTVLGEVFLCMYTSSGGKSNRSHSKSEFQMFSSICGRHVGVPLRGTNMASPY